MSSRWRTRPSVSVREHVEQHLQFLRLVFHDPAQLVPALALGGCHHGPRRLRLPLPAASLHSSAATDVRVGQRAVRHRGGAGNSNADEDEQGAGLVERVEVAAKAAEPGVSGAEQLLLAQLQRERCDPQLDNARFSSSVTMASLLAAEITLITC